METLLVVTSEQLSVELLQIIETLSSLYSIHLSWQYCWQIELVGSAVESATQLRKESRFK